MTLSGTGVMDIPNIGFTGILDTDYDNYYMGLTCLADNNCYIEILSRQKQMAMSDVLKCLLSLNSLLPYYDINWMSSCLQGASCKYAID